MSTGKKKKSSSECSSLKTATHETKKCVCRYIGQESRRFDVPVIQVLLSRGDVITLMHKPIFILFADTLSPLSSCPSRHCGSDSTCHTHFSVPRVTFVQAVTWLDKQLSAVFEAFVTAPLRSTFFWIDAQCMLVTDVLGQCIGPIFKGQEGQYS